MAPLPDIRYSLSCWLLVQLLQLQGSHQSQARFRTSSQAGSWFPANEDVLRKDIDAYLDDTRPCDGIAKVIVTPHAGYVHSGVTAGIAYQQLLCRNRTTKRVVVLAPWHSGDPGVFLPPEEYMAFSSPIGSVPLDQEALSGLLSTGLYETASAVLESKEHSIAVQIPFLKRVLPEGALLLPIYIGSITADEFYLFAQTLLPFFQDPETVFVISTGFSRWGPTFDYSYLPKASDSSTHLYQRIRQLDFEAIDCLLKLDVDCFNKHINLTGNLICGADAIRLVLSIIDRAANELGTTPLEMLSPKLLDYSQAQKIYIPRQSSVGYAAIAFFTGV